MNGRRVLVTSGPTHEAIDPVRYIANQSSGKQGHAIAEAAARRGAIVTLVSGPTHEADPDGVHVVHVISAQDMLEACEAALPVDVAIMAAAVSDWRVDKPSAKKIKKKDGAPTPKLKLVENPDILKTISTAGVRRPHLVVGFAAETNDVVENAGIKRCTKGCDWIVANDVSPGTGTFGGDTNQVHLIMADGIENWPRLTKKEVAERLTDRLVDALQKLS